LNIWWLLVAVVAVELVAVVAVLAATCRQLDIPFLQAHQLLSPLVAVETVQYIAPQHPLQEVILFLGQLHLQVVVEAAVALVELSLYLAAQVVAAVPITTVERLEQRVKVVLAAIATAATTLAAVVAVKLEQAQTEAALLAVTAVLALMLNQHGLLRQVLVQADTTPVVAAVALDTELQLQALAVQVVEVVAAQRHQQIMLLLEPQIRVAVAAVARMMQTAQTVVLVL
jgi:hypothetical protein